MNPILIEEVVRDRGNAELYSVSASSTVAEAVDVMAAREVGAVLVMNEDQLVAGIFSERDLLMRVVREGRDAKTTPVSLVMTRQVCFVTPGTTIESAMALMHMRRHRHLLVIDGPVVYGLVSMRDLVFQVVRRGQDWLRDAASASVAAPPSNP